MYIRTPRKRQSPAWRIVLLLILDAAGLYLLLFRRDVIKPIQVGPTPTPTPTAEVYLAAANDFYLEGDLDGALTQYQMAASLEPGNPAAYIRQSYLLTLRRRTAEAVEMARQAIGLAPDSAEALAALCMALDWDVGVGEEEKLQEALGACLSATDLDPGYAEGHAYLAEVYADLGRTAEAVESARLAVTLNDASAIVQRDLGYALEKQRKYTDAITAYRRASQLHPRLAQPYIDLGRIHMARGKIQDALAAYEKATTVDPGNAHAFDSYGWALFQAGDHEQAAVALKKATEADTTYAPAFGHLALAYYRLRDYEDAISAFESAFRLGITEPEYYYELGLAYAYLERCDEARPWLLKALEADPDAGPALEGLRLCPEE
ncbi:MAG TPA: tetratricopeptide repeat protein [Anaerolineae bacterium]|nr:tetratricopeptide repeat protein [Anaerolineae bacterium]